MVIGEPLYLKYTLVSKFGEPLLGATIKAKTDFFEVQLFDDGKHDDNAANDGIYGNLIDTKEVGVGTYVITYTIIAGTTTKSTSSSFKIIQKSGLTFEQTLLGIVEIGGFLIATYFVVIYYRKSSGIKQRIRMLEDKKESLQAVMKNLERDYLKRIIPEDIFKQRIQQHREEVTMIDSEIKRLRKDMRSVIKVSR